MEKSKFRQSQIVAILKESDAGLPVAQILRKHGTSQATYYVWKSKYGGAQRGRARAAEGTTPPQAHVRRSRVGERGDRGRAEPKVVTHLVADMIEKELEAHAIDARL